MATNKKAKDVKETQGFIMPMLKTVEQMSKVSGIGENRLRELLDTGEIDYISNGNRRLIADSAIWDWYNRTKVTSKTGHPSLSGFTP